MAMHAESEVDGRRKPNALDWLEWKVNQLCALSLKAAIVVLVAVGTYVTANLLLRIFRLLDAFGESIERALR